MNPGAGAKRGQGPYRWEFVRCAAAAPVILTLGLAIYWAARLAWADRLYRIGTPAAVAQARRMAPGNAAYFQGDARDRPALERAVAKNPRYAQGWIELGLLAEVGGDLPRAEQCLLAAAAVDNTYEPRWSLANYYFRRADWENFWTWTRRTAEMADYDPTPLFRLCWKASQDPAVILARAIPDRPGSLARYLSFLLTNEKFEQAGPVAERLLAQSTLESVPLLVLYCDRLIGARRLDTAVRCWNTLCRRGLLPYPALEPRLGLALTNGDFTTPPRAAGFDWRVSPAGGISIIPAGTPPALRISFSGDQPEQCDLLAQVLPVEPSRSHRLRYSWKTAGMPDPPGLTWYVTDLATGKELASGAVEISDADWSQGRLDFPGPMGAAGVRLALQYRRANGTVRAEGTLWLRRISLSFQ
jgi:hypothetical protein